VEFVLEDAAADIAAAAVADAAAAAAAEAEAAAAVARSFSRAAEANLSFSCCSLAACSLEIGSLGMEGSFGEGACSMVDASDGAISIPVAVGGSDDEATADVSNGSVKTGGAYISLSEDSISYPLC